MAVDKKANLFVVGAMRAGTTSFMELLSQHPDIYVSPIKEPHFFVDELPKEVYSPSRKFSIKTYFKNDFPKKLHIGHVQSHEQYEKLFSLAKDERYRAEASTCYLHEPNAAAKIKQYNPDAKIIIILRDPMERAYSQYAMNVGLGRENRTFEAVVKSELQLLQEGNLPWYGILNMSCYDASVVRYQQLFDDVCLVILKELSSVPKETFGSISDFLQITLFKTQSFPQSNEAIHLKNKSLIHTLKKTGLKHYVSNMLSPSAKRKILDVLSNNTAETVVSEGLQKQLNELFMERSKIYFEFSKFLK